MGEILLPLLLLLKVQRQHAFVRTDFHVVYYSVADIAAGVLPVGFLVAAHIHRPGEIDDGARAGLLGNLDPVYIKGHFCPVIDSLDMVPAVLPIGRQRA